MIMLLEWMFRCCGRLWIWVVRLIICLGMLLMLLVCLV